MQISNSIPHFKMFLTANLSFILSLVDGITPIMQFIFISLSVLLILINIVLKLKELANTKKKKDEI